MSRQNYIEEILKEEGYRITNQRKAIIDVFLRERRNLLNAQQIHEKVVETYPKVDFSTVYRNIEILVDLDIIHKINTGRSYGSYKLKELKKHHHHIICNDCGRTEVIDFCPFELLGNLLNEKGFLPIEHNFEVFGYCARCRGKRGNLINPLEIGGRDE